MASSTDPWGLHLDGIVGDVSPGLVHPRWSSMDPGSGLAHLPVPSAGLLLAVLPDDITDPPPFALPSQPLAWLSGGVGPVLWSGSWPDALHRPGRDGVRKTLPPL